MKLVTINLLAGLLMATSVSAWAAMAPVSPENLKMQASHIVSGTVVGRSSRNKKSKVERAVGIHRDRVYTIKLKVAKVSKGSAINAGEVIDLLAWKPAMRVPPLPGPQGHDSIPDKGDTVTVYIDGQDGTAYKPILPNGIAIEQKTE